MAENKDSIPNFIAEAVLKWYRQNKRILPWRQKSKDPYKIWISEIMLQQTTVSTVMPYFLRFMEKFPSRTALAQASLDEVFVLWSGLGYYRRAWALHKTAQLLEQTWSQQTWPVLPEEWKKLPGIGRYTSAAICAIAFEFPIIPVDGNINRIFSRFFWSEVKDFFESDQVKPEDATKSKRLVENFIQARVQQCSDELKEESGFKEWGDLAQGFMDLGSLICQPRQPKCAQCPLQNFCAYGEMPRQGSLKVKSEKPVRYGEAFCVFNEKGEIFLQKETESTLLQGLWKVPIFSVLPFDISSSDVSHVFTHFIWKVKVCVVSSAFLNESSESSESDERLSKKDLTNGRFFACSELDQIALSSLMKKIIRKGLDIKNKESFVCV